MSQLSCGLGRGGKPAAPVTLIAVGQIKEEEMKRFKNLIASMPVNEQAFTSKRETWEKYVEDFPALTDMISSVFGHRSSVEISRQDLFELAEKLRIRDFIFSTILWGYPAGMRGNHFPNILKNLNKIEEALNTCTKNKNIRNWRNHYLSVIAIDGLGLSTYTKFLYFLKMRIENYPALILDLRLIDVFRKGVFHEFRELRGIRYDNAPALYPSYLQLIETTSIKYDLVPDNVEMFLFEFGGNLKFRN
jgi:hypothetical protein